MKVFAGFVAGGVILMVGYAAFMMTLGLPFYVVFYKYLTNGYLVSQ